MSARRVSCNAASCRFLPLVIEEEEGKGKGERAREKRKRKRKREEREEEEEARVEREDDASLTICERTDVRNSG